MAALVRICHGIYAVDFGIQRCEDKLMNQRSAFHLDCTAMLPWCGCNCDKCIEEMASIFADTEGVSKFYREGNGVVVEHDPQTASVEQLMDIFKTLPSFYEGRFVPVLMTS